MSQIYLFQIVTAKSGLWLITELKQKADELIAVLTEVNPNNYSISFVQSTLPVSELTPAPLQLISRKLSDSIVKDDQALYGKGAYSTTQIATRIRDLWLFKSLECGWRQSCGSTDATLMIHRAWLKILKQLRSAGFVIGEQPQKHGNAYATSKGGFWQSIVYKLESLPNEST